MVENEELVPVTRTVADMRANLHAAKDYRNWNTSRIVAALNDLETLLNLVEKHQSVLWPVQYVTARTHLDDPALNL